MKCPNCGKENIEESKFCSKCGTLLVNEGENDELKDIYTEDITMDIVRNYAKTNQIDCEKIYQRSKLFDMSETEIAQIAESVKKRINKFNAYMQTELEESLTFSISKEAVINKYANDTQRLKEECDRLDELSEHTRDYDKYDKIVDQIEELCSQILDIFNSEEVGILFDAYIERYGIKEKEKFLTESVQKYCETGEFQELEEGDFELKEKYDLLKENMKLFEEQIALECNDTADFMNSYPISTALSNFGEKLGFSETYANKIMSSYRVRSGVEARVIREAIMEREAPVFECLAKLPIESKKCRFYDIEINFEKKYFVEKYIHEEIKKIIEECAISEETIQKIRENEDSVLINFIRVLDNFYNDSYEKISQLEESLGTKGNKALYDCIDEFMQSKSEDIITAIEEINQSGIVASNKKIYREFRKDTRARWSGGGFGIEGAIRGAVDAGILNVTSGATHSIVNGIQNGWTDYKYLREKDKIIDKLCDDVVRKSRKALQFVAETLIKIMKQDYPDCIQDPNGKEIKDVLKYLEYNEGITEEEEIKGCAELLQIDPYESDVYLYIMNYLEVESIKNSGLMEIAEVFEIDLINALNNRLISDISKEVSEETIVCFNAYMEIGGEDSTEKIDELVKRYFDKIEKDDTDIFKEQMEVFTDNAEGRFKIYWEEYMASCASNLVDKLKDGDKLTESDVWEYIEKLEIYYNLAEGALKTTINKVLKIVGQTLLDGLIETIDVENVDSLIDIEKNTKDTIEKYRLDEQEYNKFMQEIYKQLNQKILTIQESGESEKLENCISELESKLKLDLSVWKKELERKKRTVYDLTTNYVEGKKEKSEISNATIGKEYSTLEEAQTNRLYVKQILHIYDKCELENESSLTDAINLIMQIFEKSGYGKKIIEELNARRKWVDKEKRTVLGKEYSTIEEADNERKKVVGNQKFDTEEAANQERERIKHEKELNDYEIREIEKIKAKDNSAIAVLKEIKIRKFQSKAAKEQEKYYENIVISAYNEFKEYNVESKRSGALVLGIISLIVLVIAILIAIIPFLAAGWLGKIIIFMIVAIPFGLFNYARDTWNGLTPDVEAKKLIERTFIINGNNIYLK